MKRIHARKVEMTQLWKDDKVVPVTVLKFTGAEAEAELFASLAEGQIVHVTGTSKGKGFQGVVKRHGFHGGPATHGQKNRQRAPGSIGSTAPQRVLPGRRMAGHMGSDTVTIRNLKVAAVQPDAALLFVRGAVPGARGTKVTVRNSDWK